MTTQSPGLSLDLGSGPEPAPGYVGVDLRPSPGVLRADLFSGERWPFADESVERLRAWHVIEHIPQARVPIGSERVETERREGVTGRITTEWSTLTITQNTFFWFFDEAYRIAAPGCRFELAWPHPLSDGADQDPTHCRRIPSITLQYLSKEGRQRLRVCQYPVACDWLVEVVTELGSDESLAPYTRRDGIIDVRAARSAFGAFHEIRAVLFKPTMGPSLP